MTVTAFQDYPLADRDREWDSAAAEKRIREWAGAEDEPNAEYRDAHVWYDGGNSDNFTAYKLLIADVIDGKVRAVPRAIMAAGNVMQAREAVLTSPTRTSTASRAISPSTTRRWARTRLAAPVTALNPGPPIPGPRPPA